MTTWTIQVFFDGDCPLCAKEIALLRRADRRERILFTDISSPEFEPSVYGRQLSDFMDEIQGRLPDGTFLTGMEVIRRLYEAVGLGFLTAWTRWPGASQLSDGGYRLFAKNRLRLTGRCTPEACDLPGAPA